MKGIKGNFRTQVKAEKITDRNKNSVPGTSQEVNETGTEPAATSGLLIPSHLNNAAKAARYRILGEAFNGDAKLPKISPQQFEELIHEEIKIHPTNGLDLAAKLIEKGYSKNITGIQFSESNFPTLRGMKLKDLTFNKCIFDWNHLSETEILNCNFSDCGFSNVSFMNSHIHSCQFENCKFKESMFINSHITHIKFHHSTFVHSSFEDAEIAQTTFKKVQMPGTHFLDALISKSTIEESDLTDTVFFGKKSEFSIDTASITTAKLTKPTSATLVFPECRGISIPLVGTKISGVAQSIPVRIAMQSPLARKEDVDQEVEDVLDKLGTFEYVTNNGKNSSFDKELSIAQRLLKAIAAIPDAYPCASHIVAKAESIANHVDSVVLPGGEDVSPRLYGEEKSKETKWDGDYRRSLMELGLIHQCFNKGIPLMAICRGFQMTSAYFGGKLHQHIGSSQVGVRILGEKNPSALEEVSPPSGLYGNVIKGIRAAVYHHQAVPVDTDMRHIGPSLTHTITDLDRGETWDVIMAVEQNSGAPILGVQFHPEFFNHNLSIQAPNTELTNAELLQLSHDYVRPGTDERGLRDPADMVNSGILAQMSPGNDDIWKMLADAANAYRNKAEITREIASAKGKIARGISNVLRRFRNTGNDGTLRVKSGVTFSPS